MENKELKNDKIGDWISKKIVMKKMDYKETQMAAFLKEYRHVLKISRIGNRVFVSEASLIEVINMNEI